MKAAPAPSLYTALYLLNLGFDAVLQSLTRLKQAALFEPERLELCRVGAQELRAGMNNEITEKLRDQEEHRWAHFGLLRIRLEKQMTGSDFTAKHQNKTKRKEEHQHGRRKARHSPERSKKESLGQKGRR